MQSLTREQLLEKQKNNAYWERNQLVSALSKVFRSHLAKHPDEDKDWEDDWRTIVVIYIPCSAKHVIGPIGSALEALDVKPGRIVTVSTMPDVNFLKQPDHVQLTWHIHDTDRPMFDHLPYDDFEWDGHDTEEKYRRLRTLKPRV